ncbi:DUF393 domain-containing protein [Rhodobacteraceae bacterium CCMM004]|nr:DUF393 domain-containing protein [Rhodobacteraceae bacterium CCMM004]
MSSGLTVIYNRRCPICRAEISAYRRAAEAAGAPVVFVDLHRADLGALGLTPDGAARRLHAVRDGRRLDGIDAFVAVWRAIPRYAWAARLAERPGLRPVAAWLYERVAAPALYRWHRWRTG